MRISYWQYLVGDIDCIEIPHSRTTHAEGMASLEAWCCDTNGLAGEHEG